GVCASAACFDKEITHIVAERSSIPMAKWLSAKKGESYEAILERVKQKTGFPAFIKPANSGSSVGTCPIPEEKDLKAALEIAFAHDKKVIIEEHLTGHEVECAVMGNDSLEAPQTGEIVAPEGFYDYDSKYNNNSAKLLIPANISFASGEEVKKLAKKAFTSLGCRGYARVDFFVTDEGKVIFNEINTLPGFTSISMFPQMMCVSDYSLKELISKLLSLALEA
ncbi:MAG: ATP-grasp domain-containing protein, partial [Oscillospiraceae bacterium]